MSFSKPFVQTNAFLFNAWKFGILVFADKNMSATLFDYFLSPVEITGKVLIKKVLKIQQSSRQQPNWPKETMQNIKTIIESPGLRGGRGII